MARAGVKTAGRGVGDFGDVEASGGSGSDVAGSKGVGEGSEVAVVAGSVPADDVASVSGSSSGASLQAAMNTSAEHTAIFDTQSLKPKPLRRPGRRTEGPAPG
jgi:hypothetical protein